MLFEQIYKKVEQNRVRLTDTLIAFIETDAILFAFNEECMADYQSFVLKANKVLNTAFILTNGLDVVEVNSQQGDIVRAYFDALSVQKFTLLYLVATKVRSVLLGVLFAESLIDWGQLFDVAYYEELWQQKKWGVLAEETEKYNAIKNDLMELERARDEICLFEN